MHQACQVEARSCRGISGCGTQVLRSGAWGRSGCVFRTGEAAGSTVAVRSEVSRLAGSVQTV